MSKPNDTMRRFDRETDGYLRRVVLPRIKLLETIAGAALQMTEPDSQGLALVDHLLRDKPIKIDAWMSLGDLSIVMAWDVQSSTSTYSETEYWPKMSYKLSTAGGAVLADKSWSLIGGVTQGKGDDPHLRRGLLDFVVQAIGTCDDRESIMGTLIKRLRERGEPFAPTLGGDNTVRCHVHSGEVEKAKLAISAARRKAVAAGVKPQYLAYLDFERSVQIEEARRRQRLMDQGIPLIRKVGDETARGALNAIVVPGQEAEKTYNFFLYYDYGVFVDKLVEDLSTNGYGGSVLICTYNEPSGHDIAGTGQLHGLFMASTEGNSWWLDGLQGHLRYSGFSQLPQFIWSSPGYNYEDQRLAEFLKQNFPLS